MTRHILPLFQRDLRETREIGVPLRPNLPDLTGAGGATRAVNALACAYPGVGLFFQFWPVAPRVIPHSLP